MGFRLGVAAAAARRRRRACAAELAGQSYGQPQARSYDVPISFTIRQLAMVQQAAQQAIEPQALALAVLGGLAALALIILMAQGLAQLLARPAADAPTLRALGASRAEAAAAAAAGWGLSPSRRDAAVGGRRDRRVAAGSRRPGPDLRPGPRRPGRLAGARRRRRRAAGHPADRAWLARLARRPPGAVSCHGAAVRAGGRGQPRRACR